MVVGRGAAASQRFLRRGDISINLPTMVLSVPETEGRLAYRTLGDI